MTYSPKALSQGYPLFEEHYTSTERSGIAADKAGYHNSRKRLKAVAKWKNDYSIKLDRDNKGDEDAASAFDVKLNREHLAEVCHRLMAASIARDPRLVKVVREWYGSFDGDGVDGYSLWLGRLATSDSSHEWHLHISGWRDLVNDEKAWLGVFEVCLGLPAGTLTGIKPVYLPAYIVDPLKVSTTLIANAPSGLKDATREPGFRIYTGVRIEGDWLVTEAGYRYHTDYLVLESEYKKRTPPGSASAPAKPVETVVEEPAPAKPAPSKPASSTPAKSDGPTFKKVAYVNPPGVGNFQGAIPTKDNWYVAEARKQADGSEDTYVWRFPRGAEGAQVLTELQPFRLDASPGNKVHPTGWGVSESGVLWFTWNGEGSGNDVITVNFVAGGRATKEDCQEMHVFTEGNAQIAFDEKNEFASVRVITAKHDTHYLRSKKDILDGKDEVLGKVAIPRKATRVVQGYTLHEEDGVLELRVLCGLKSKKSPFQIERWNAKTGEFIATVKLPELGREPEGIDGEHVGFKVENRSGIDVFRYTV